MNNEKHPGGRPLKYETVEELQTAIDKYFDDCIYDKEGVRDKQIPPTIVGLALSLGFESRQSILDYKKRDQFSCTIIKARMRIEQYLEEKLSGQAVAGIIFNLKNNYGWVDANNINVGGQPNNPVQQITKEMSAIEAAKIYKQLMSGEG